MSQALETVRILCKSWLILGVCLAGGAWLDAAEADATVPGQPAPAAAEPGSQAAKSEAPAAQPPAQPDPNDPVHQALDRRAKFSACRNKGIIQIIDPLNHFKLGVNVEVHASSGGYLKIRATKAAFKAFTILMTPGEVQFYLPREGKFYTGSPDDFARILGLFSPTEMLQLILEGHPEFLQFHWAPAAGNNGMYEMAHDAGTDFLRVRLNGEGLIARVEYILASGQLIRAIDYDNYMPVDGAEGRKLFPRVIDLQWPEVGRKVTVKLRGVDDSPATDAETWTIEAPANMERRPLLSMQMQSDE